MSSIEKSDIICSEMLKHADIMIENSAERSASANRRRQELWEQIARLVHKKCFVRLSVDQMRTAFNSRKKKVRNVLLSEQRYRNATGGGVDEVIEQTIADQRDKWNCVDNELARYFGTTTSFKGLRNGESFTFERQDDISTGEDSSAGFTRSDNFDQVTFAPQTNTSGQNIQKPPAPCGPRHPPPHRGYIRSAQKNADPNEFIDHGDVSDRTVSPPNKKTTDDDDVDVISVDSPVKLATEKCNGSFRNKRQLEVLAFESDYSDKEDEFATDEKKKRKQVVSHADLLVSQRNMFADMKLAFDRNAQIQSKMLDRLEKMLVWMEAFESRLPSGVAIPAAGSSPASLAPPTASVPTIPHSADSNVDASVFSV